MATDRGTLRKQLETEPNRPTRTEPNRTEPSNSNFGTGRNRTRKRTEPNWTEPLRVQKTQAEPRRTGTNNDQTEPNRNDDFSKITEPKRIEPNQFLPAVSIPV